MPSRPTWHQQVYLKSVKMFKYIKPKIYQIYPVSFLCGLLLDVSIEYMIFFVIVYLHLFTRRQKINHPKNIQINNYLKFLCNISFRLVLWFTHFPIDRVLMWVGKKLQVSSLTLKCGINCHFHFILFWAKFETWCHRTSKANRFVHKKEQYLHPSKGQIQCPFNWRSSRFSNKIKLLCVKCTDHIFEMWRHRRRVFALKRVSNTVVFKKL